MSDNENDKAISNASKLCLSCSLCCHGIMEKAAVLEPCELEMAKELKLDYYMAEDGIYKFNLPCRLINGTTCTVYSSRHPNVCKEFQCILLDMLLNNEVSLEASIKTIQRIKKYINLIKEKIPNDGSKSFMAVVEDYWDLGEDLNEELLPAIAAFRYLMFRYIMNPSKPYCIDKLFFLQHSIKDK